jgi:23S rRNA pseudouridine1911/1915/1917 synthase
MEKTKIIFEDDFLLVVEKPAGLTTTKERKVEEWTLEDDLRKIRPNELLRNGIVHRLDKGTSGLVLMAKNSLVCEKLKEQFKVRKIVKKYICLVGGDASMDGEIRVPIRRSKYGFGKFGVGLGGKEAWTKFELLKKYRSDGKIFSLLEIDLKTGRTHQIRVHMSYLGWPLVGDKLYGGNISILKRPFLHAKLIQLVHPVLGEIISFKSDLPVDLKSILKKYEKI